MESDGSDEMGKGCGGGLEEVHSGRLAPVFESSIGGCGGFVSVAFGFLSDDYSSFFATFADGFVRGSIRRSVGPALVWHRRSRAGFVCSDGFWVADFDIRRGLRRGGQSGHWRGLGKLRGLFRRLAGRSFDADGGRFVRHAFDYFCHRFDGRL